MNAKSSSTARWAVATVFFFMSTAHAAEGVSSAVAKGKADVLPPAVAQTAEEMRKSCREVDGKPLSKDSDFVDQADLTGDGLVDYVLDQGRFECEGARSLFSGTAGSEVTVYVSTSAGSAIVAWDLWVHGSELEMKGPKPILYVNVSGAACGQKDAASHADEMACQRPLQWNAAKKQMDYAPLSEIRPFKP